MKKISKRLSALFAALMIFMMSAVNCMTAFAADVYTVPVSVKYDQAGARSMLDMINKFRTGKDAWYWNESSTEKIYLSGLEKFQYDYGLEQAAMQRAAEIAVNFAHVRPNGTMCFTAANGYSNGENIAAGYNTVAWVFEGWQETNEKYAGQGHRRNMLGDFSYIGIAHVNVNGMDYWVQEFGYRPTGIAKKDVGTGATNVNVDIAKSDVGSITLTPSSGSITVPLGGSADLPSVTAKISMKYSDYFAGNITSVATPNWSVNGNAISVSGGKISGKSVGSATLTASLYGKSVSVTVKVECTNHKWSGWNTTTAATCTKDGSQSRKCSLCGKTENKAIAAKGHSYGEYKVIRKATASQEGLEERVCSVCGDKQQRTIAKIVTTTTKKTTTPKTTTKTTSGGNTTKTTTAKVTTENGGTTNSEVTTASGSTDITTSQESYAESGTTTGDVTTVEVTTPKESEVTTTESTESDESTESKESTENSENTESTEITEPSGNNSADNENSKGKSVLLIVLGGAGGLAAVGVIFVIIRKIRN